MISNGRKQEIDFIVTGIKEAHDCPRPSMEDLLSEIGIELKVVPTDAERLAGNAACYYRFPSKEVIYLSSTCPPEKQAFILAHELGHAILHDVEMAHCQLLFKSRKIEEEADYFAVQLLKSDFELIDGYTSSDYAALYGMREEAAEYLINQSNQQ